MTSGNAGAGPDPGGNGALEKSKAPLFCVGQLWYNNRNGYDLLISAVFCALCGAA